MAKKETIKVFGFKVRDPKSGKYLSKNGLTGHGKVWTRKYDAINAVRAHMGYKNGLELTEAQSEVLTWEFVELVEGGTSSILFELDKLSS